MIPISTARLAYLVAFHFSPTAFQISAASRYASTLPTRRRSCSYRLISASAILGLAYSSDSQSSSFSVSALIFWVLRSDCKESGEPREHWLQVQLKPHVV